MGKRHPIKLGWRVRPDYAGPSLSAVSNVEPSKSVEQGRHRADFHPEKLDLAADLLLGKAFWPVGFLWLPFPI